MHVVTTPTGQIGSKVVQNLLAAGEPVRVIARDPKKLPADVRDRVEVVQGSSDDETVLNKALNGAETFFLLVPPSFNPSDVVQYYMQFTQPACNAIKKQGVKRVVAVSGICHNNDYNAGPVTASYLKDVEIEKTGVHYRALWCPGFMDNMLRQIEPLKHQNAFYYSSDANKKLPHCATRDIATSGARLLMDRSWTGQGGLAVLGPEDLSFNDIAAILTDVLGKSITYHQVPKEQYKEQMIGRGASPEFAQAMIDMFTAKDNGIDDEPRTAENTTPTSFRQWAEEELVPAMAAN